MAAIVRRGRITWMFTVNLPVSFVLQEHCRQVQLAEIRLVVRIGEVQPQIETMGQAETMGQTGFKSLTEAKDQAGVKSQTQVKDRSEEHTV